MTNNFRFDGGIPPKKLTVYHILLSYYNILFGLDISFYYRIKNKRYGQFANCKGDKHIF